MRRSVWYSVKSLRIRSVRCDTNMFGEDSVLGRQAMK